MNKWLSLIIRVKERLFCKTHQDDYMNWLGFANAGMLHPGNIYAMKYVAERLPAGGAVIEIGSFCGLSANTFCYLLTQANQTNPMFCADKWQFENADPHGKLGNSDVSHQQYRQFVKDSFARNITLFSKQKPFPIEVFSDEFFSLWHQGAAAEDIFGRNVTLGGPISYAYIDGNHTYDFTRRDFENVDCCLLPGGFILFDDTSDSDPYGLTRLMKEISQRPDYELVMKNPNYLFRKK